MAQHLCKYKFTSIDNPPCYYIIDTDSGKNSNTASTIPDLISYATTSNFEIYIQNEDPESDIIIIPDFDPSIDYTQSHPELFI